MNANEEKREAWVSEWMERARECRSSGLRAWCAEREIKPATRWEHDVLTRADGGMSKRSANRGTPEETVAFVELPEGDIHKEEAGGKGRVVAEMETGKGVIRVYEGADAEVIRALCGAALC